MRGGDSRVRSVVESEHPAGRPATPVPTASSAGGVPKSVGGYDKKWTEITLDKHLIAWLDKCNITSKVIFHFGTGNHHALARSNRAREASRLNVVIAITASPQEFGAFQELAATDLDLLNEYLAIYGDIYRLNAAALPVLDIVSLPHLCEYSKDRKKDRKLLEALLSRTHADSVFILNAKSNHWNEAEAEMGSFSKQHGFQLLQTFQYLRVYGRQNRSHFMCDAIVRA